MKFIIELLDFYIIFFIKFLLGFIKNNSESNKVLEQFLKICINIFLGVFLVWFFFSELYLLNYENNTLRFRLFSLYCILILIILKYMFIFCAYIIIVISFIFFICLFIVFIDQIFIKEESQSLGEIKFLELFNLLFFFLTKFCVYVCAYVILNILLIYYLQYLGPEAKDKDLYFDIFKFFILYKFLKKVNLSEKLNAFLNYFFVFIHCLCFLIVFAFAICYIDFINFCKTVGICFFFILIYLLGKIYIANFKNKLISLIKNYILLFLSTVNLYLIIIFLYFIWHLIDIFCLPLVIDQIKNFICNNLIITFFFFNFCFFFCFDFTNNVSVENKIIKMLNIFLIFFFFFFFFNMVSNYLVFFYFYINRIR